MFGREKPKMTNVKWEIITERLHEFEVTGLAFASYQHSVSGKLEGGYEVVISAHHTESHRDDQLMPVRRMLLKLNSDGLHDLDPEIIGGGRVCEEYFDVHVQLPRDCVRDILSELERHKGRVRLRVDGFEISEKIFRVTLFALVPLDDTSVYVEHQ